MNYSGTYGTAKFTYTALSPHLESVLLRMGRFCIFFWISYIGQGYAANPTYLNKFDYQNFLQTRSIALGQVLGDEVVI